MTAVDFYFLLTRSELSSGMAISVGSAVTLVLTMSKPPGKRAVGFLVGILITVPQICFILAVKRIG